ARGDQARARWRSSSEEASHPEGEEDGGSLNAPSVGRIVHYQAYGTPGGEYASVPRAAVITQVGEGGAVGLCILNPTGQFFNVSVPYSEEPKPGCWNWPPRVP
ncbi:MAG: hypothetical protein ABIP89_12525, partial [Polyangiaceae bacterium]